MSLGEVPLRVVAISAGLSEPSATRMLADRAVQSTTQRLRQSGRNAEARIIELAPIAADIAHALVGGLQSPVLQEAVDALAHADGIIVSTPVYKAGISGLFKSFIDLLDNDLLIAKPVILASTAGSERHAMVVDDHLRPLFAFMRTIPVPTSLFAAPDDWAKPTTSQRIERATGELAALIESGVGARIAEGGWGNYQHSFGGRASRAARSGTDVDLATDLMRLARGGR